MSRFYLDAPRKLDLPFAEHLYDEATNQRVDKEKNIFAILRQSLKLGNAKAGWILVNFSRPTHLESQSYHEKIQYFCYLVATALLDHDEARVELRAIINTIKITDLLILQSIVSHYHTLDYDIGYWERIIQSHLSIEDLELMPFHTHIDDGSGDGVPPH